MRLLHPRSPQARHSAQPPNDMSGNFPAHMSVESLFKISPNPQKFIQILGTLGQLFKNTPLCALKYSIVRGLGGFPEFLLSIGIIIFLRYNCTYAGEGYMPQKCGYIARRTRLYFAIKIGAYLSYSAGCMHFARSNFGLY
jgi:hypothetical protein